MVVTTKNGENLKKPIINFRVEGAISQLTNVPKMVDGITYMRLYNEAQTRTPETTDIYSDEKINATIDGVNPYMYPNIGTTRCSRKTLLPNGSTLISVAEAAG